MHQDPPLKLPTGGPFKGPLETVTREKVTREKETREKETTEIGLTNVHWRHLVASEFLACVLISAARFAVGALFVYVAATTVQPAASELVRLLEFIVVPLAFGKIIGVVNNHFHSYGSLHTIEQRLVGMIMPGWSDGLPWNLQLTLIPVTALGWFVGALLAAGIVTDTTYVGLAAPRIGNPGVRTINAFAVEIVGSFFIYAVATSRYSDRSQGRALGHALTIAGWFAYAYSGAAFGMMHYVAPRFVAMMFHGSSDARINVHATSWIYFTGPLIGLIGSIALRKFWCYMRLVHVGVNAAYDAADKAVGLVTGTSGEDLMQEPAEQQ